MIKTRRKQLKLGQRELATRAGVTQTTICRIETGQTVPHIDTAWAIANALESSLEALFPNPKGKAHD